MAPFFRDLFRLSASQTSLLIALPVILGALARIPIGLLADKFGGKPVFFGLMVVTSALLLLCTQIRNSTELMVAAFFLGIAGASFTVGVQYVSSWVKSDRQGAALGIYGIGNIGQSFAVSCAPLLVGTVGWQNVFAASGLGLFLWSVLFLLFSKKPVESKTDHAVGGGFGKEPKVWLLAFFYFLTFGGFVALSIYLPTLLRDEFSLDHTDAGIRTAIFVAVATFARPVGGWLSDKVGGAKVLSGTFFGISFFGLLMAWPSILPFTVGALGAAALLGFGNGAIFKLAPEISPARVGAASGLIGAIGCLGGFFPPLLLGYCRQEMGQLWPAFILLSGLSLLCLILNNKVFVARQIELEKYSSGASLRSSARLRAASYASLLSAMLVAAIIIGSRKLQNFDPALVIYTFSTVFALWGITYHYYFWLQKPPTNRYWVRGWQLFRQNGLGSAVKLITVAFTHLFAQNFIRRRSRLRWIMHQCLFWGCNVAVALTFPLVFGWIHFGTRDDNQSVYVAYTFGFPTMEVPTPTVMSWLLFHILDFAAILVLIGVGLSLWRRMRDKGALAVQTFALDFFPLFILTAISITGLALTVSTIWLRGDFYDFLSIIHAITVIMGLLYLPFGKFFHIFQRPAQLGVKLYHEVGERSEGAICIRCKERFASRMHIEDLNDVLAQLGFDYSMPGPAKTWQEICPPCKRKSLASAVLRMREKIDG